MEPTELHNFITELLEKKKINEEVALQQLKDIPEFSDGIVSILHRSFGKRVHSMLKDRRCDQREFENRHYLLWKTGFDLLETYLVCAYEISKNYNKYYRREVAEHQGCLTEALTRIHARTVHVGFEVFCLLRYGFADGAHARWRTAHELAVVARFLLTSEEGVVKRYLEHEAIVSYKDMIQYHDYTEELNLSSVSQERAQRIKKYRDDLVSTYGKSFETQYGWAADALKKDKPTFYDIEKEVEMDHMRPYYNMASHNVHANPKGIQFRLGLPEGKKILLAGPSNYGLADPAQCIAYSIFETTSSLLSLADNMDSIVMEKLMKKYMEETIDIFVEIQLKMDKDDKSLQDTDKII